MNVSSVFAADTLGATMPDSTAYNNTYTTITSTDSGVKYTYDFGAFAKLIEDNNYNSSANCNFKIEDGTVKPGNSTHTALAGKFFYGLTETANNLQVESNKSYEEIKFADSATALTFTIADNCTATMKITVGETNGGSATVTNSSGDTVTASNGTYSLSSGAYTIKRASKLYIKTLEITVSTSQGTGSTGDNNTGDSGNGSEGSTEVTSSSTVEETTSEATTVGTLSAITADDIANGKSVELKADNYDKTTYSSAFLSNNNKFQITADSENTVVIDGSSKTISGTDYTQRIKLGGKGTADYRSIKFEIAEGATPVKISIDAASSNSSDTRTVGLYKSDGTEVDTQSVGGTPVTCTFKNITDDGVYYIATEAGGLNVYGAKISAASTETDTEGTTNSGSGDTTGSTDISLDFTKGKIITDSTTGTTYYIKGSVASIDETDDYDVKITNVRSHGENSSYGLQQSGSFPEITFNKVTGPVKITLGTTDYGGYFDATATGEGQFVDESGNPVTELSGDSATSTGIYYYTGTGEQTITLTGTKGSSSPTTIYISTLAVKTVSADDVPAVKVVNDGVKVTVNGATAGDIVILKDSQGNAYTATLDVNSVADFSGNNVVIGDATVTAGGYTVEGTINITTDTTDYTVSATSTATEAIPEGAATDEYYVGYKAKVGYNVYGTVQAAHDAATDGAVINVAEGEYYEANGLIITKSNITINGKGERASVIYGDDSQQGTDRGFHGDSVIIKGTGFKANNLTIQNRAEETGKIPNVEKNANATALGIRDDGTAVFDNCNILAVRDTIYVGNSDACALTLTNCTITGFQDTICGQGTVKVENCTMDPSRGYLNTAYSKVSGSSARLFVPYGNNTVFTVTNLNIDAVGSIGYIYLGRPWGVSYKSSKLIIDGYTVATGTATTAFNKAVATGGLYGFDVATPDKDKDSNETAPTTDYFFLVRPTNGKGNFNTTLAALNETATDEIYSVTAEEGEENTYRIIGKVNSALVEDADVSAIGFAVSDENNGFIGNMSSGTIYVDPALDNTTEYFTVNFATDVDTTVTTTLTPYVNYKGYDVVSSSATAEAINYNA
jgi:hypothetical protein